MINNKKILEAVNRGIKLALDDYQDIEDNNSVSHTNDIIDSEDTIKNKIEFWKEWVDLGLPSGTLWAKYNIGVDFKNLNYLIENTGIFAYFGDYYAWGDIEYKKQKHAWKTYKFTPGGVAKSLIKYVSNEQFAGEDNLDYLNQLEDEDDVAYIKHGENPHIHMPTIDQIEELLQYTTHEWVQGFNGISCLEGCLFTSLKNKSKFIFIPASGYYGNDGLCNIQKMCGIWSSSQIHEARSDLAAALIMTNSPMLRNSKEPAEIENRYRYSGFSIRAVYNK